MMKNIRKKTQSTSFEDSPFVEVTSYLDVGCLSLNSKISGTIHGGIPEGRITTFSGESATGKSLVAAMCITNALKKQDYDKVFYFDSEGGGLVNYLRDNGVDFNDIEHNLVGTIEQCNVDILQVLDDIEELKQDYPDMKFLIVLDSLGGLVYNKLRTDALEKGRKVIDMGIAARLKNDLMKSLLIPVIKTNTTMIVLNHVYDDPAAMYPSKIKNQPGGKGIIFASEVIVQTSKKLEDDKSNKDAKFNGNRLGFFTTKNRVVKPFHETEMFVDFDTGIAKYDGLLDDAKKYGYIKQAGAWYTVPSFGGDKKYRVVEILENDEMWNTFLNDLDEDIGKNMRYGAKRDEEIKVFEQDLEQTD